MSATTAQIKVRDAQDSTVVDFHNAGDGVIAIDSTNLTLDQTIDTALHHVYRSAAWHGPNEGAL